MACPICNDSTATDTNDRPVCKTRYLCVFCAKRLSYRDHTLKGLDVAVRCADPTCARVVGRAHTVCVDRAGRFQIARCLDHYVEAMVRDVGLPRDPVALLVGDYLSAPDYKQVDLKVYAGRWGDEAKEALLPLHGMPVPRLALVGEYVDSDVFSMSSARSVVRSSSSAAGGSAGRPAS